MKFHHRLFFCFQDAVKLERDTDGDDEIPSDSGDDEPDSNIDTDDDEADDDDAMDIEDMEGTQEEDDKSEGELVIEMAPKRSLYMSEKSSKYKKMLKDGKVR